MSYDVNVLMNKKTHRIYSDKFQLSVANADENVRQKCLAREEAKLAEK